MEKGVIDRSESLSDDDYGNMQDTEDIVDYSDDIIGHLQDTDGTKLTDLVFYNVKCRNGRKSTCKYDTENRRIVLTGPTILPLDMGKKRKTKFICDVCNRGFIHEFRFLAHRSTHHNVRYECTQCITQFAHRSNLAEHQKLTGHIGEGIIEGLDVTFDKNSKTFRFLIAICLRTGMR